jgi:uncharacterized repeat protein (TIGR03803 family)
MGSAEQHRIWSLETSLRAAAFGLAVAILLAYGLLGTPSAQAQTFKVLYSFTGQKDGGHPYSTLAMDRAGNLYGTAYAYGKYDSGTVFRLMPNGSGWLFNLLYAFTGDDGSGPDGGVTMGRDGSLYGITSYVNQACGVVYNLKPPPSRPVSALASWNETVIHKFTGPDGCVPVANVTFDAAGNLYGVANEGGAYNGGTVYELSPSGSGWTEKTLHSFGHGSEGTDPSGTPVLDSAGNLYGTAGFGGPDGAGSVFQMTPSGSGWTLNVLTGFPQSGDGFRPYGGVILDHAGNVYGTTSSGGTGGGGTVFMLGAGTWNFSLLYSLSGDYGPTASLIMDAAGNLYGTTPGGGAYQNGSVFKLTPSGAGWIYTALHDFTGGSDGEDPDGSLLLDADGNLYGTASSGGSGVNCSFGCGVVFEITP